MGRTPRSRILLGAASLAVAVVVVGGTLIHNRVSQAAPPAVVKSQLLQITRVGAGSLTANAFGVDTTTQPNEIDTTVDAGDADGGDGSNLPGGINRVLPQTKTGHGRSIDGSAQPKSNPALGTNFDGLNFHDQRYANHGNQFSVEPPDQGLCVGNGYVVESINDVLRVYHTDGSPATGVVDLNTFYGYAPAIVRSGPNAGQRGPTVTDPVCTYDATLQRFVEVVLTLDHVGTTASLSGNDHLDIAISDSADPTAGWTIYKLPAQNNGTEGTPNHGCAKGYCLGDYPHIGADANGIYLTTNEFATLGGGFYGAQVYAIGNSVLTGQSNNIVLFDTLGSTPDGAGFAVWPAQSPSNQFDTSNGGTEYFLSSRAVFADSGASDGILLWTLSNTSSLNTSAPAPTLAYSNITVDTYAVPGFATQKAGSQPLSQCIADLSYPCNIRIAGTASHNNTFNGINANDSRMQQVFYANGKVWGALDTDVVVGGQDRAGIAYYVVNPGSGKLALQGTVGVANTDLTYPALAVTDSGRGVVGFTLTGDNLYPSAAYAGIDAKVGLGDIHVAAAGVGPWDGFTAYRAFGSRPRWGDYGAASVDGSTIWIASEYIGQTCSYDTYKADPTCGGTRGALGNYSTHISQVTP